LFLVLETGGIDAEHLEISHGAKMVSSASGSDILDLFSKAGICEYHLTNDKEA
jgi:hypothetical protein